MRPSGPTFILQQFHIATFLYKLKLIWKFSGKLSPASRICEKFLRNVLISGEILASHLLRYWLGVFPEHTQPGDPLYSEGEGEASSCDQADWFRLCPPHKEYNRSAAFIHPMDLILKRSLRCFDFQEFAHQTESSLWQQEWPGDHQKSQPHPPGQGEWPHQQLGVQAPVLLPPGAGQLLQAAAGHQRHHGHRGAVGWHQASSAQDAAPPAPGLCHQVHGDMVWGSHYLCHIATFLWNIWLIRSWGKPSSNSHLKCCLTSFNIPLWHEILEIETCF